MGGAGVTILSFLSMAIIGNLYSSESFAIYRLVLTYGAILFIFFTLRIELSIILSKNHEDAVIKVKQLIAQVMTVFFLTFIIFNFFNIDIAFSNFGITKGILNLFLFMGIFVAFTEIFIQYFIFNNKYKSVSFVQIAYNLIFIALLITFYFIDFGDTSPSLARILCLGLGSLIFFVLVYKNFNLKKIKNPLIFIKNNKDYPLKNLPYSVLTQFTQSIPILLLIYLGSESLAGKFAFLLSLAMFPGMFLNGTIGKVFFRKTAELSLDKGKILNLLDSLMNVIIIFTIPLSVIFFTYHEYIITLLFGDKWLDLSLDPRLIFLCGFLYLFSSWPERIFVVFNKQGLILKNQIVFDFLTFVTLLIIFLNSNNPIFILIGYIFINILYHISYTSLAYLMVTDGFKQYFIKGLFFTLFLLSCIYFVDFLDKIWSDLYLSIFIGATLILYIALMYKRVQRLFIKIGGL